MYIQDGVAYAAELIPNIEVSDIKIVGDMIMLVTFSTGEQRVFDASQLLKYDAFAPLEDPDVFNTAKIECGVVTWDNGTIDIAPETMYAESYVYENPIS